MPHLIIEHKTRLDTAKLARDLHEAAMGLDAFPLGGIRTRDYACPFALVGDGDEDNEFCYVTIRLGAGRSDKTKLHIGEVLFAVLSDWADPAFAAGTPLSLGLEIQEIAPNSTWKRNNIHDILKAKKDG